MSPSIPPLLAHSVCVPPTQSLTLLTGFLGATTNWLILRYLYAALGGVQINHASAQDEQEEEDTAVVLVSYMRDLDFWKTEAKKSVGLDLARLQKQGRFTFVDGLTQLFVPPPSADLSPPSATLTSVAAHGGRLPPSLRPSGPVPIRRGIDASRTGTLPSTPDNIISHSTPGVTLNDGIHHLTSPALDDTERMILSAIEQLNTPQLSSTSSLPNTTKKIILILDTPTILLSTSSTPHSTTLLSTIHALRSHPSIHATVISLPADDPFLTSGLAATNGSSTPSATALEIETAAFTVAMAQSARCVVACRRLGSGWASDVSGVVRVTGGAEIEVEEEEQVGEGVVEGEWLYHVAGDGGVRVWSRGSS